MENIIFIFFSFPFFEYLRQNLEHVEPLNEESYGNTATEKSIFFYLHETG